MKMVTGIISVCTVMCFSVLDGMKHDIRGNFVELSMADKSSLVYDAIATNDVDHLYFYIVSLGIIGYAWKLYEPLNKEPHPTWTALAWAISLDNVESVRFLLSCGNLRYAVDGEVTALEFAQGCNAREDIIQLLEHAVCAQKLKRACCWYAPCCCMDW
jgi:hypothetical protein